MWREGEKGEGSNMVSQNYFSRDSPFVVSDSPRCAQLMYATLSTVYVRNAFVLILAPIFQGMYGPAK